MDERHNLQSLAGRSRWRLLRRGTSALALLLGGVFFLSPMGCYLSRAAYEEARILAKRQPIDRLVADSSTPAVERAKLALVLEARQFAIDSLGLDAKQSFTRYTRLDRDTLVLVVSAAYQDRLARRTWWFPVVGRFPYKGFFDFGAALRTADELRAEGFDVTVGASSAFSTLGWFNDPVVSTTLALDSVSLVNTVIHELTHSTFFAKGQVVFNESFASFVGGRGSIAFFRARGDSALQAKAEREWSDDQVLGAFWASLYAELDSAFAAHPDGPDAASAEQARLARLEARDVLYARARTHLANVIAPQLSTIPSGWAQRVPLNNAVLMARRVYATGLSDFEAVYQREGRNMRRAFARVVSLHHARPDDPFAAVRTAAEGQ